MDTLCRLCMNFGSVGMEPIFRSVMAKCIASKIIVVTQLTVFEGDGLPANACQECISKLDVADGFIQKCIISDKALRAMHTVQNAVARGNNKNSTNCQSATNNSEDMALSNAHRGTSDLRFGPSNDLLKDVSEDLTNTGIGTCKAEVCDCDETKEIKELAEAGHLNLTLGHIGTCKAEVSDCDETKEIKEFAEAGHLNLSLGHTMSGDATISNSKETEDFPDCSSISGNQDKENNHIDGLPTGAGKEGGTSTDEVPIEIHQCNACHVIFSSKRSLASHAKVHKRKKIHNLFNVAKRRKSCRVIPAKPISDEFRPLERNEVSDGSAITCGICCEKFVSQPSLARHACHPIRKLRSSRHLCPQSSGRKDNLEQQKLKHPGKQLECIICNRKFKIRKSLTDHIYLHLRKRPFSCPHCNSYFKNSTALKSHMATHSDLLPYECAECGITYKRREHLERHTDVHRRKRLLGLSEHSNKKSSNCSGNSNPVTNEPLSDHPRPGSPNPEDIGDNSILRKDSVQSSEKSPELESRTEYEKDVTEKLITCKICEQTFNKRPDFDSHVETHKAIREYLFPCQVCGRQFTSEASVTPHMSIHARIAIHKCSKCTQCFKTTIGLKEHMELHENNLEFMCSICSKTFTCNEGLQYHLIAHAI